MDTTVTILDMPTMDTMDTHMLTIMVTTMGRGPLMLNPRLLLKLSQRLRLMLTMDTMDIPLLMPTMDTTVTILDMPTMDTMDILMPMLVITMARDLLMLSPLLMLDTFMDTMDMDTLDMPTMDTMDTHMPTTMVITMARGLLMLRLMPDTFMDTTAMDTDTMDMDMLTMATTDILMPTMDTMDTIIKLVLSRIEDLLTVKLVEYLVTMA